MLLTSSLRPGEPTRKLNILEFLRFGPEEYTRVSLEGTCGTDWIGLSAVFCASVRDVLEGLCVSVSRRWGLIV